tara:strand:- start:1204 stop:1491 length:288 start_codon:yes stop_codon:yes gene_type:complete
MAHLKKAKQTKFARLLNEARANPLPPHKLPTIEDTLECKQISRLKPLAWLIETQKYTVEEIMTTALAYQARKQNRMRAEEILQLIKARQQEQNGK